MFELRSFRNSITKRAKTWVIQSCLANNLSEMKKRKDNASYSDSMLSLLFYVNDLFKPGCFDGSLLVFEITEFYKCFYKNVFSYNGLPKLFVVINFNWESVETKTFTIFWCCSGGCSFCLRWIK